MTNLLDWQIKALEHNLLMDYNQWASDAVEGKSFPDIQTALDHKIKRCSERMISAHEAVNGQFEGSMTQEEKVLACVAHQDYKNRAQREAVL